MFAHNSDAIIFLFPKFVVLITLNLAIILTSNHYHFIKNEVVFVQKIYNTLYNFTICNISLLCILFMLYF